ncbi:hypothetical protein BCU70_19290 [Vibrio sp. 10N.286.49.C2]|uniref:hypothetical protein n=1 Tax=unclassified Vibrio TaxID=2614977 RepID=UPI000C82AA4A|nr:MULTISPECIES: hypothetical protein [unclassified Vibrio]PMH34810.1 hypothetical protein BCU70_19290 [Vibrio sp. 10N.286.49.C2]PMH51402.1 hypothetical protein BCU66_16825 [Vibrio sp. 10N.286.49.B1]PMH81809.1 hypothetical protein BCU58_20315 [Vibrio sp. 10N.286.48.B7]
MMRYKVTLLPVNVVNLISGENTMTKTEKSEFRAFSKGLKYERLFRNLGKQVFSELQNQPPGCMTSSSLELLSKMENHNTVVMAPVREQYGVNSDIGCKDKLLAKMVTLTLKAMPYLGARYLEGSAERFVCQLKEIEASSPDGYETQMTYMVEHEEALHGYLVHLNNGDQQRAHSVLEDFISDYNIQKVNYD